MNISPVSYQNYKEFLADIVSHGRRGIVKKLALAAGCQRSYFSQVLNSHVHLTSDHVWKVGEYLGLKLIETEYLLLLLEREKVASPSYKKAISEKMHNLRSKFQRLTKRVDSKAKVINERYYSAWYYSAIHIATALDHFKEDVDFSKAFGLSLSTVGKILRELSAWGLVSLSEEGWCFKGGEQTHLPDYSLLNRMNHFNWRAQSLQKEFSLDEDVRYTSVFALSKKDTGVLRSDLLRFIEEQRSKISQSASEEVYVFCADFFKATNPL